MELLLLDDCLTRIEAIGFQLEKLRVQYLALNDISALSNGEMPFDKTLAIIVSPGLLGLGAAFNFPNDTVTFALGDKSMASTQAHAALSSAEWVDADIQPQKLIKMVRQTVWRKSGVRIPESAPPLEIGDITVDSGRYEIRVLAKGTQLSVLEMELVYLLGLNANRFVTQEKIARCIWNSALTPGITRSILSHMKELRDKIEPDRKNPRYLTTKRGAGYMLSGGGFDNR